MRVLVCGGRDFADGEMAFDALDKLAGDATEVIHGGARGADRLAHDWAAMRSKTYRAFPANWAEHGKAAGPIRNQQMLDDGKTDLVIAFPGGKGTADMVRRARHAGVRVVEITDTPPRTGSGSR